MRIAEDIRYYDTLAEALVEARRRNVPIALKALGQGFQWRGEGEEKVERWCPAASVTRAIALSDCNVAALLNEKFVSVRYSMWLQGPGTDDESREITFKAGGVPYPGLIVLDPQKNILAKTYYSATAEETLSTLRKVLREHPELAEGNPEWSTPFDLSDPAEATIVQLQALYKKGDQAARRALIPEFRRWLDHYALSHVGAAAVARTLLGECHYCVGEYDEADRLWAEVERLHPKHPMVGRATFDRLDKHMWPEEQVPELRPYPLPPLNLRRAAVPFPELRAKNFAAMASDPRYRRSPGGDVFVEVPAGTFTMGSVIHKFKNERPFRTVTLTKPYMFAALPVTRAQWHEFRPEAHPNGEADGLDGELPQADITWYDAVAYCEWRSARDGWNFRLPTEAEWERAARGGLEGKAYSWGDEPLDETRAAFTVFMPVGSYAPNGFGIFDVVGNGGEWCSDRYMANAFSLTPSEVTDPTGPTEAQDTAFTRVLRSNVVGDHFNRGINYLGWRSGTDPNRFFGSIGMRLCADVPEGR